MSTSETCIAVYTPVRIPVVQFTSMMPNVFLLEINLMNANATTRESGVVLQEQATNEPSNQVQEKTLGGASDRDK